MYLGNSDFRFWFLKPFSGQTLISWHVRWALRFWITGQVSHLKLLGCYGYLCKFYQDCCHYSSFGTKNGLTVNRVFHSFFWFSWFPQTINMSLSLYSDNISNKVDILKINLILQSKVWNLHKMKKIRVCKQTICFSNNRIN